MNDDARAMMFAAGAGLLVLALLVWLTEMLVCRPRPLQAGWFTRWGCRAVGWVLLVLAAAGLAVNSVYALTLIFTSDTLVTQIPAALGLVVATAAVIGVASQSFDSKPSGDSTATGRTVLRPTLMALLLVIWSPALLVLSLTVFIFLQDEAPTEMFILPMVLILEVLLSSIVFGRLRHLWKARNLVPDSFVDQRPEQRWWLLLGTGPGVILIALIAFVILGLACLAGAPLLTQRGNPFREFSFALPAIPLLVTALTGITLIIAEQTQRMPWSPGMEWLMQQWSRLLKAQVWLYLLVGAGFLAAVSPIAAALILVFLGCSVVLSIAGFAANRQSSRLSTLWTLAICVSSRRPLTDELAASAEATHGRHARLLHQAHQALMSGASLEHVLREEGQLPRSAWLQVQAGLATNSLDRALRTAAAQETARLRDSTSPLNPRLGLEYLAFVLCVAASVTSFVMYYIIPKFKKIFDDFGTELPGITLGLVRFSDSPLGTICLMSVPPLVALCTMIGVYEQRYGWFECLERSPLGYLWPRLRVPDLLRGLRYAIDAGQPLDAVLEHMAAAPLRLALRERLFHTATMIRSGTNPWESLRANGWLTQPEYELLHAAERLGTVPWALEHIAESCQQQIHSRVLRCVQLLQPLAIAAVALLVGWIALSFFMPLIKLLGDFS